jgi:hypothetical protein
MRAALAALALALILAATAASAATRRPVRHWDGADLPVSCNTVRAWRSEIEAMSPATRAALAGKFRITRKQRRQAQARLEHAS